MIIRDIAMKVAELIDDGSGEQYFVDQDGWIADFAEALVAELAKENEPVRYALYNGVVLDSTFASRERAEEFARTCQRHHDLSGSIASFHVKPLYTLPPTAEHIEQETAEAIAKHFEQSGIGGEYLAEAIRSGAWKEYK